MPFCVIFLHVMKGAERPDFTMKRLISLTLVLTLLVVPGCKDIYGPASSSNSTSSSQPSNSNSSDDKTLNDILTDLALIHGTAIVISYQEDQNVPLDDLYYYFAIYGLFGENRELKAEYTPYLVEDDDYVLILPTEMVLEVLYKRFKVRIDDSSSKFYVGDSKELIGISRETRGGMLCNILNTSFDGNRVTITFDYGYDGIDDIPPTFHDRYQICVENYNTEGFRFVSCRELPL